MSTRLYTYRIVKERWWAFAKACREYYLANHPIIEVIRVISEREDGPPAKVYRKIIDAVDAIADHSWTVDLQIFDEGDTWLIRPLENGYFFMNHRDDFGAFNLHKVFYDNRADVPPEDEPNEAVAKWVDEKITSMEYLTFTVLNRDDFAAIAINRLIGRKAHA